jgi:hypothetical protein
MTAPPPWPRSGEKYVLFHVGLGVPVKPAMGHGPP